MSRDGEAAAVMPTLVPDWDAGSNVGALITLRAGGVSRGPFGLHGGGEGGLNLGARCGDEPELVQINRARVRALLPSDPVWLRQVHGIAVQHCVAPALPGSPEMTADAAVTDVPGVVLAVLTADCLPVLLADSRRAVVGVAHAGWRGLAGGVIEQTIAAMLQRGARTDSIAAYLGPAIGPGAFEVGEDVVAAFERDATEAADCFRAAAVPGKWYADLYALARLRLSRAGVETVSGGINCTHGEPAQFYSYRRDGATGRMGSFIWIRPAR